MTGLGNPDRPVGGLAVPRPAGVELRPLGRDDLSTATALVGELYALPEMDVAVNRDRFDALVNDVDAAPYLALTEGEPAGLVIMRFRRRLNRATYEGWVSELIVRERFRGRGIGRALLAAAIADWRLRGSHRLVLEVADQRTAARALYVSLGLTDAGRYLELAPARPRGLVSPPAVELRPLLADDFDAATRLLASLGRPVPGDERLAAVRRTFDLHLARPSAASFVAVRDGTPVGICVVELREHFYVAAPQAWIGELIVDEASRGAGIGAALLDRAIEEAQGRGAYAVVTECGGRRMAADALLRTAGMIDVGSSMELVRG